MTHTPEPIAVFLRGKRIAVAGVSRSGASAANAVFGRLRDSGYEAVPVNPNAAEVEGTRCYPDLASVPGHVDGVIVATHPEASLGVVRQALERGVRIWLHRSFGRGSVSKDAAEECSRTAAAIVGGCPLMYLEPVDLGHRCIRAWLSWRGRLPG